MLTASPAPPGGAPSQQQQQYAPPPTTQTPPAQSGGHYYPPPPGGNAPPTNQHPYQAPHFPGQQGQQQYPTPQNFSHRTSYQKTTPSPGPPQQAASPYQSPPVRAGLPQQQQQHGNGETQEYAQHMQMQQQQHLGHQSHGPVGGASLGGASTGAGSPPTGFQGVQSTTADDVGTFNGGSYRISHRDSNTIITLQLAFGCPMIVKPGKLRAQSLGRFALVLVVTREAW